MRVVFSRHCVEALIETRPGSIQRLTIAPESEQLPFIAQAKSAGVKIVIAQRAKLDELAKSEHHQGVIAEAADFEYAALDAVTPEGKPALVLALDSVQDPHNLGALIRSAECFGATGVVIPQDRAAAVTSVVERASAGAVERIAVARIVNLSRALEELKQRGVWVTGLAGEGTDNIESVDMKDSTAIVVGAEGSGLRPVVRKACDRLARIPLVGRTESLNASVAGAIALHVAALQRGSSGRG